MKAVDIELARAKSVNPEKIPWDNHEWFAEPKVDGWRFILSFGRDLERPTLTGKRTSSVTGLASEKGLCAPCLWPDASVYEPATACGALDYTVLDCEVLPPVGAHFRDIAGIMNVAPEDAARRIAEIGQPRLVIFDLLFFDGEDWREKSQIERSIELARVLSSIDHPLWALSPRLPPTREQFQRIISAGGEGVILKNIAGGYGESGAWLKVKRVSTLDVIVTDYQPGKGKYDGQVGAVCVSVYGSAGQLLEVGRVSGMTDEIRREISDNRGAWLGRVLEIEAQEFALNRLRHPRWVRARSDSEIDPRACTYAKMIADLGAKEALEMSAAPETTGQRSLF